MCRRNGHLEVVEYSEISAQQAAARDTWGRLQYNWSNVCMHYFSVAWLTKVVRHLEKNGARCPPPHLPRAARNVLSFLARLSVGPQLRGLPRTHDA